MKKIILGITALLLSLTLTACGPNQADSTVTNLGNQLDETANTISKVQTVNPNDLNMSKETLENLASKENSVYDNAMQTQNALLEEEYYKTDILNKTAKIKNCLSKDIKLSKAQTSAIKDLTNSLSRYTNSVAYTKNEMNNALKSIATMKKNPQKNYDKINAKLNRLICNSNARSCYYENLLNTLERIENYICTGEENTQETPAEETENQQTDIKTDKISTDKNKFKLTKNIDTYLPQDSSKDDTQEQQPSRHKFSRYNRYNIKNTDTYGPTRRNIDSFNGFNGYGYNGYGNGYGFNGYGNGYGYGFNGYNGYGNGVYNSNNINRLSTPYAPVQPIAYTNVPEERMEEYEKVNENGDVEKIEQPTCPDCKIREVCSDIKQNDEKTKTQESQEILEKEEKPASVLPEKTYQQVEKQSDLKEAKQSESKDNKDAKQIDVKNNKEIKHSDAKNIETNMFLKIKDERQAVAH